MTLELQLDAMAGFAAPLGSAFRCVVADPPWDVKAGPPGDNRGWAKHGRIGGTKSRALAYPTMTVEEIAALKIPAADDAHLYIWTVNKYVRETYDIARAWGFEPSTLLYWLKSPMGIGLGGTFSLCVEPILFCRRGTLAAKKRLDRNWWNWPRVRTKPRSDGVVYAIHSAKPEEFQTLVESVSPGPYLEMFARRKREGWSAWGNEIANDVEMPNAKLTDGGCVK